MSVAAFGRQNLFYRKTIGRILTGTRECYCNRSSRIYDVIKATGPMTVAQYMRECLLNPVTGYYIKGGWGILGREGDFVTSPEISQVFGELLGVWVVADWMIQGKPSPCHLIELGPGRGSMMKDMIRVFAQLKDILPSLVIHLIEASPTMRHQQRETLTTLSQQQQQQQQQQHNNNDNDNVEGKEIESIQLKNGINVHWHSSLTDVPHGFNYFVAHEFFDVLPIHQFIDIGEKEWREVFVDIETKTKSLKFVKSPNPTPASLTYTRLLGGGYKEVEVCPDGLVIIEEISRRVKTNGGGALIADYGDMEIKDFTFRGYSGHRQVDVLSSPGDIDLTADVNFSHLIQIINSQGCVPHGPVSQSQFLHKMGIRQRLDVLLEKAEPEVARGLINSYQWLTSPEEMGERFKFLAISKDRQHVPTPFE